MTTASGRGLDGLTVLAFESRRAAEIAELIRRHGGNPVSAPALREVPLEASAEAQALLARLEAGTVDVLILLTGVGTRALVAALAPHCPPERLAARLRGVRLVARGPKPVAALRALDLTADVVAPEPNTWRELLAALDAQLPLAGLRVALQEYGQSNAALVAELQARAAELLRVPVYRWDYPEDAEPLRIGVAQLAAGAVDIAVFTSAQQVVHVVETAARLGRGEALRAAMRRVVCASIGPVCSEALQAHELPVDLEPEHPKMGQLIGALARQGRALLAAKRGAAPH